MEVKEIKTVVENLADFIDVPNGIERLKDAVLSLATAGLLTEQKKDDGSSEDLYGEIIKHNPKLKSKSPTVDQMDGPYKVPSNWKWVKLNSVFSIVGGGTPRSNIASNFVEPQNDKAIHWITPADIRKLTDSMYVSHGKRSISKQGFKSSSAQLLPKGSILFSSRAPIGYVRIAKNDLTTNQGFKSCVPFDNKSVDAKYVFWFLKSRVLSISENATGTTFKEVSGKSFGDEYFALPPLAEQKRIVERVDELMKLIDQLELEKKERDEVRGKMAVSAFYSFGTEHNDFALKHLTELVKTPSDIDELEKSILSLAVLGKLTDSNDESKWSKKKILEIADVTSSKRIYKSDYLPSGIPFLRIKEISKLSRREDVKFELFISEEKFEEIEKRFGAPKEGDLLLTAVGTIGNTYIVKKDDKFYFKDGNVLWFRDMKDVSSEYLKLMLANIIQEMKDSSNGAVYKALTIIKLKALEVNVPPLNEQKRIVTKVNELKVLVQKLRDVIEK